MKRFPVKRIIIPLAALLVIGAGVFTFFFLQNQKLEETKQAIVSSIEAGGYDEAVSLIQALDPDVREKLLPSLQAQISMEEKSFLLGITEENYLDSDLLAKGKALQNLKNAAGLEQPGGTESSLDLYLQMEKFAPYEPFIDAVLSPEMEEYMNQINLFIDSMRTAFLTGYTDTLANAIKAMEAITYAPYGLEKDGVSELEENRAYVVQNARRVYSACITQNADAFSNAANDVQQKMSAGLDLVLEAQDWIEQETEAFAAFQQSLS